MSLSVPFIVPYPVNSILFLLLPLSPASVLVGCWFSVLTLEGGEHLSHCISAHACARLVTRLSFHGENVLIHIVLKIFLHLSIYLCEHRRKNTCNGACVEDKGHLAGIFPLCGFQNLNSGPQGWQRAPPPAEPLFGQVHHSLSFYHPNINLLGIFQANGECLLHLLL